MGARLSVSERMLREISEADWQAVVVSIARINGWTTWWAPPNRPGRNGSIFSMVAGWPDLVFLREGEFFVAELKREIGKTSPEQDEFLRLLRSASVEAYVWRPSDERAVRERLGRKRAIPIRAADEDISEWLHSIPADQ